MKQVLGAFIGDIIGSPFEGGFGATGKESIPLIQSRFTDDSVMTAAVADWYLYGGNLRETLQKYWRDYPNRGYGEKFAVWCQFRTKESYQSFGNGSAMRCSMIGWNAKTWVQAMQRTKDSCMASHDHIDAVVAAQVVVGLIYLARLGWELQESLTYIRKFARYPKAKSALTWHDNTFYVDARSSVQLVLDVVQEAKDWEMVLRSLIYIGGDVDTNCCIAGAILEAFVPPPSDWAELARRTVPAVWKPLYTVTEFVPEPLPTFHYWKRCVTKL